MDRDQYDHLRTVIGIHPEDFRWKLAPGESFQTPEAVLVYSGEGFNSMSPEFHRLYADRLFPRHWAKRPRPILLNSWKMCYFDVSEEKLLQVIRSAAEPGFELVVLDDGWFEPEMISPDSDLMRAHPDWAAQFPGGTGAGGHSYVCRRL